MFHYAGMKWYLLELGFYGTGVLLYGVCCRLTAWPPCGFNPPRPRIDEHRSSAFPSVWPLGASISGAARISSSTSLFCARCTQMSLLCSKASRRPTQWIFVSYRVLPSRIGDSVRQASTLCYGGPTLVLEWTIAQVAVKIWAPSPDRSRMRDDREFLREIMNRDFTLYGVVQSAAMLD